ncbi:MAG: hypothetical protein AAFX00_01505 [Pseudomonadota bacterium]
MKHGVIIKQSLDGTVLNSSSFTLKNKIGLGVSNTYRFVGYKTSLLRFMIDNEKTPVTCMKNETLHIKIGDVAKSAMDAIIDTAKKGAIGLGGVAEVLETATTVLDGISSAETIYDIVPKTKGLKRPSNFAYHKDHALHARVIVDLKGITPGQNARVDGFADIGVSECTLIDIASLLQKA